MRLFLIIGVPIFFTESCFLFLLTTGLVDSTQLNNFCNDTTECTYQISANFADCKSRNLNQIPPSCSSAIYLDIRKNDLTQIGSTSFSKFKNLKYLYIDGNHIKNITPRAFEDCTSLQQLFLQNNPIYLIRSDAFAGLENLLHLYLNLAELRVIRPHSFDDLRTLQRLYLSDNRLDSLPQNLFQNLGSLEILTLANNQLHSLESNIFQGLERLEYLDLKFNQLTSIPRGLFNNMFILIRLSLSYNSIYKIEKGAIDSNQLINLERLDIQNNFLTNVANFSNILPSIPQLYLAGNPIHCTCQNSALLRWYQQHPSANESGIAVLCHSPFTFMGRHARDIADFVLPCEDMTEPMSTAHHFQTLPKTSPVITPTSLYKTNFLLPHLTNDNALSTTDSEISVKENPNLKEEKEKEIQNPKSDNTQVLMIIFILVALLVIIITALLIVYKCTGNDDKKPPDDPFYDVPDVAIRNSNEHPTNMIENQSANHTGNPNSQPLMSSQNPPTSDQQHAPTSTYSPNDSFNHSIPGSPPNYDIQNSQPPTSPYLAHDSLPSMTHPTAQTLPHSSQTNQRPQLMHSSSTPTPAGNSMHPKRPHSNSIPCDMGNAVLQQKYFMAPLYSDQIIGQIPIEEDLNNNNLQDKYSVGTTQAPIQSVPQTEIQTRCQCAIPHTNPFCHQNTVNIQSNPLCT